MSADFQTQEERLCSKCSKIKSLFEFSKSKRRQCKSCYNAHSKARREANLEQYKKKQRERYQNNKVEIRQKFREVYYPKYGDKQREWQRTYIKENRDRIALRNSNYRRNNRERCREYCRRYDARKVNATIGKVSYEEVVKKANGICYLCGWIVLPEEMSIDHVIPLSRGGAHSQDNLEMTHKNCNSSKGSKLVSEL